MPPIDRNSSIDVNRLSTWYEDLEEYEGNLEEMATANLDQTFQDEMAHVNQWFGYLSDPEKTATLYTLLQHSSQVQIRFFIHLLQEMRKPNPNPINRGSERASTLANLNRRQHPPTTAGSTLQPNRNVNNRHSFAIGDTEELSRMFGTDWLNSNNNDDSRQHTLQQQQQQQQPQQPQPRVNISNRASSHLRPKSVMELGGNLDQSFSNSWLNQRQPTLFSDNVIERPRSADISSWALPTTVNTAAPSWKPLGSQHDIDFQQHWKEPLQQQQQQRRFNNNGISDGLDDPNSGNSRRTSTISTHSTSNGYNNGGRIGVGSSSSSNTNTGTPFAQYLSPPKSFNVSRSSSADLSDTLHGYGSDHSDASANARYRATTTTNTHPMAKTASHVGNSNPSTGSGNENREEVIDMELLKDVTAWLRSLRLHKYNSIFEPMRWQDIIKLDDEALQAKGVAALGARRKMLKIFENIREHCKANNIEY